MKHPAVAMVGVVGVPDKVRTEIVKAFVQLRPEVAPSETLRADLAAHVKTRLAAHEYPREVEFVDELPLTTTGKILRRELRRLDAERKAGTVAG
jgi:acetyl-CoA synthetase